MCVYVCVTLYALGLLVLLLAAHGATSVLLHSPNNRVCGVYIGTRHCACSNTLSGSTRNVNCLCTASLTLTASSAEALVWIVGFYASSWTFRVMKSENSFFSSSACHQFSHVPNLCGNSCQPQVPPPPLFPFSLIREMLCTLSYDWWHMDWVRVTALQRVSLGGVTLS